MEIIAAGVRGGGTDIEAAELGRMQCEGGLGGYAQVVTRLLEATFGTAAETSG
jgi:Phage tail tube protein, GTA-gp10